MGLTKYVVVALLLAGCGGAGSALTGPSDVERGEAGATNPARNVTVICEDQKNGNNVSVVTNITNNCNKNNNNSTNGSEAPAP